jgi:hypothetical protein
VNAQLSLFRGRALKVEAVQRRSARDPLYLAHAMAAIHELACCGGQFTSDDVHDRLGEWTPTHPNSMGSAIHSAVTTGIIVRVGYRQSRRPEAHARVVGIYRGAQ